jgi:anti-sigma B factor antagonist
VNGTTFDMHEEDGVPVARLSGEVDISRAAAIRLDLLRALSNLHHGLVVDLRDVSYLDSAGVNVLFEVAERLSARQQALATVIPDDALIQRVAQLVNLGAATQIHRDLGDAVASIRALDSSDES